MARFFIDKPKKAPGNRGFLGFGIVPTGELEGRQDARFLPFLSVLIVPTGELEGRQDFSSTLIDVLQNCTNWGVGRAPRLHGRVGGPPLDCTNWGVGRAPRLPFDLFLRPVYCTNWGVGRAPRLGRCKRRCGSLLYQLGSWKGAKTARRCASRLPRLYQLGSWKGAKTEMKSAGVDLELYQLGSWKGAKTKLMLGQDKPGLASASLRKLHLERNGLPS